MIGRCLIVLWLVVFAACVSGSSVAGEFDESPHEPSECSYAIAYLAPAGCGDIRDFERRLGAKYRVVAGSMQDCPECVRGIAIRETEEQEGYLMHLSGFDSKDVQRASCGDLLELAAYSVVASDLPAPVCDGLGLRLGASSRSWANLSHPEWVTAGEVRLAVQLGDWSVAPLGIWLVPSQVSSQQKGTSSDRLELSGYGAGGAACWAGLDRVGVCGIAMWRAFMLENAQSRSVSEEPATLWSAGAELTWTWSPAPSFSIELAPSILVALASAETRHVETGRTLYQHRGVEAHLRVGLSWDWGAHNSPDGVETLRVAESHVGRMGKF